MMKNFSFVAVVLLSLLFGISSGFVVPSTSALNVRQSQQSGGMRMFFGGGGGKKAAATSKGIVVKVQQKTGFKETELVLKGKTNLRKALLENKIDVYPLQARSCLLDVSIWNVNRIAYVCEHVDHVFFLLLVCIIHDIIPVLPAGAFFSFHASSKLV